MPNMYNLVGGFKRGFKGFQFFFWELCVCIKYLSLGDIAVGSAGSLPGDMQRLFRPTGRDCYHMEYGFSNMGYEPNGALGVKLACPDREVYTFFGDGTYLMAHSELVTCVQEHLRVHFCLFDNSAGAASRTCRTTRAATPLARCSASAIRTAASWTARLSPWISRKTRRATA